MAHTGKVIFGQIGDLLVYFRRKVSDFQFFYFWGIYGQKSGKFGVSGKSCFFMMIIKLLYSFKSYCLSNLVCIQKSWSKPFIPIYKKSK